ncbi:MAG: fibrobacter succinogenes major paralogous domain-containing protein [Dysgonamonadaceae bacterium]|jgi:uncharacterized protein (TIGR02145 family)|nr:fibrobacter succinogenes major paralogous domain-containing protein [Dysgonamonadaceae bacterium]
MKKRILVLLSVALALSANLRAQVTIGGVETPKAGAILDLNSTAKGGLLLSNVSLGDLYTIPTAFPDGATADKSEFKGAIVYNTNSANGVGIYLWNGTNWTPAGENCKPLTSAQLIVTPASAATIIGGSITFSVTSGESERCALGETYLWSVSPSTNTTIQTPTSASTSIKFSAAATYKVKVAVTNRYANSPVESAEITVNVISSSVPSGYYNTDYDLSGSPCYDVKRTATEPESGYTARADSFANANYAKTYSFVYGGNYSNLLVNYNDPNGLVERIIQPAKTASNTNSSGREPFTVVFKSNVNSLITSDGSSKTLQLGISYTDAAGDAKLALRNISVQDAACHCPARTNRYSDTWMTLSCHNVGGQDITFATPMPITRAHHGNWYRWGASAVSMANTVAHDTNNSWDNTSYQSGTGGTWNVSGTLCPTGWRLLSATEWQTVMDNNSLTNVPDPWTPTSTGGGDVNVFENIKKVGDYLYLPAAGSRQYDDGHLSWRGASASYWTNTGDGYSDNKYKATAFLIYKDTYSSSSGPREWAYTLRCKKGN